MLYISWWKKLLVLVLCIGALVYALPSLVSPSVRTQYMGWMPVKTVNLGLDLQGGSHLLLEVQSNVALREYYQFFEDEIRAALRQEKIAYTNLSSRDQGVSFSLIDAQQQERAIAQVKKIDPALTTQVQGNGAITVSLSEAALRDKKDRLMSESIEIVRRRVDELGTREPSIQRQGEGRILVQVPGLQDPGQLKEILSQTAKLYFRFVEATAMPGGPAPLGSEWLPMADEPGQRLAIKRQVMVSGENLVDAQPSFSEGQPVVSFRFDSIGSRKFADATTQNVGQRFAIVLDNKVISAPRVNEPIIGGSGVISGGFTTQEAQNLSVLLRAGALPAPLSVLEERTVGPGLGADSIRAGTIASLAGMGLVIVFMLLCYGFFGLFGAVALILNISFILAFLAALQATLTLPGIAGIVLTMGMAVDANVLIFERMREEARLGRSVFASVDAGYSRALSAIVDSNITTLIAAALLFLFGSGPVRGFSVTLFIGIITSLFSAIMVTRVMIITWLHLRKPKTLPL